MISADHYLDVPPNKYDHPYPGIVFEKRLSWDEIDSLCGIGKIACSLPGAGVCFLYMPKIGRGGLSADSYVVTRRHEIGHCNGWRH